MLTIILIGSFSGCGGNPSTSFPTCSIQGERIICPDGSSAEIPKDGKNAEPCVVSETDDGATVTCGSNVVTIKNGTNGQDGSDGVDAEPSPYAVTEIIDPCGDDPGKFDEVLLKLYDGSYVSYFEDGGKRFLTVLEFGKIYQTTDRQKCKFKVDLNGNYEEI